MVQDYPLPEDFEEKDKIENSVHLVKEGSFHQKK